jgi:hypothetical protein
MKWGQRTKLDELMLDRGSTAPNGLADWFESGRVPRIWYDSVVGGK